MTVADLSAHIMNHDLNMGEWDGDCSEDDEDMMSVCPNTDELDTNTINNLECDEYISSGVDR